VSTDPDPITLPQHIGSTSMSQLQGHLLGFMLLDIRDHDPSLFNGPAQTDENYSRRNTAIYTAVATARAAGLVANVSPDPTDSRWCIAYIELPTGQVSWHVPAHPTPWDGHTTEEKYKRCASFYAEVAP
jgi:hypothetical protein